MSEVFASTEIRIVPAHPLLHRHGERMRRTLGQVAQDSPGRVNQQMVGVEMRQAVALAQCLHGEQFGWVDAIDVLLKLVGVALGAILAAGDVPVGRDLHGRLESRCVGAAPVFEHGLVFGDQRVHRLVMGRNAESLCEQENQEGVVSRP